MHRLLLAALILVFPLGTAESRDLYGLNFSSRGDAEATAEEFLQLHGPAVLGADASALELRLKEILQSLTGSHLRYQQFFEGVEVVGGEVVIDLNRAGTVVAAHGRTAKPAGIWPPRGERLRTAAAFVARHPDLRMERIERVALPRAGELRPGWRIIAARSERERFVYYLDEETLKTISIVPLFFNGVPARVFRANPVTVLNDPTLQDHDNAASAVPNTAYSFEELLDLAPSGPLRGPFISIVEMESPITPPADASLPLSFDRSQQGFEDVMAYYHLDRSQRYLQSLGYTGSRQIIARSLRVDAHAASGGDHSYYAITSSGEGALFFGDGGVDDAEDPDILLHEYGHAIHEGIAPSIFFGPSGSPARALSEGFGDYWAFSSGYAASIASGRDPFCVGDWDARCADAPSNRCLYAPGQDCLRRVDGSKTMDDFNPQGSEHANGEIWSSALRQIFVNLVQHDGLEPGRRAADQLVLESMFGMPPSPTFRIAADRLLLADRLLFDGANEGEICSAMQSRKVFGASDCSSVPRGQFTFFPSSEVPREIPDANEDGIVSRKSVQDQRIIEEVQVRVEIEHPFRGDLRLRLTGPNGATVTLYSPGPDSGDDLRTTFGYDSQPVGSLDAFRGISARGLWTLHVADLGSADLGRLLSWSLILRFQGDSPLSQRLPETGMRKLLPAIAHAAASSVVTDVRIFNRGSEEAKVTLFFTSSGLDGTSHFSAVQLSIAAHQNVLLSDIVPSTFRSSGSGAVEIRGDLANLRVSSRSYRRTANGTLGHFAEGVESSHSAGRAGPSLHVPQLRQSGPFRSTVGFSEIGGSDGIVDMLVFDDTGRLLDSKLFPILPYSHLEVPALASTAQAFETGRAELRLLSGDARIVGYGVVTDTSSSDSTYIPAATAPLAPQEQIIPAVIRAEGISGTSWRTDVTLTNLASTAQSVELSLTRSTGTRTPSLVMATVPAKGSLLLADVLQTSFGTTHGSGQLVARPAAEGLLLTSRTWTAFQSGTVSQFIGSGTAAETVGFGDAPLESPYVEHSTAFRTNIGITEVTGTEDVVVRVRFFDAAGAQVQTHVVQLSAGGQVQLNIARAGVQPLIHGRVSFEVIGGRGRILSYASVVDNQSADASYVPAKRP
jgi:subtilisin-like proprotein convertase family protein